MKAPRYECIDCASCSEVFGGDGVSHDPTAPKLSMPTTRANRVIGEYFPLTLCSSYDRSF